MRVALTERGFVAKPWSGEAGRIPSVLQVPDAHSRAALAQRTTLAARGAGRRVLIG